MQLFLCSHIENQTAYFTAEEGHHICKVLRKTIGESLHATDGKGKLVTGKLTSAQANNCSMQIEEIKVFEEPPRSVLAVALPKSKDRVQWLVEKCVELGLREIQPIYTKNSERHRVKEDKLQKIAISAMKQSAQFYLPIVKPAINFQNFLEENFKGSKFIAYCPTNQEEHLQDQTIDASEACVIIGPEGDFTEEEVNLARSKGYQPISLGPTRLRTETAAFSAIHCIHLNWQKNQNEKTAPAFT